MKHVFSLLLACVAGAVLVTPAVAQAWVVNAIDDADDGRCDAVHCSLREAILAANGRPGPDRITFAAAPLVIRPAAPLPPLSDAGTTIDGAGMLVIDGDALPRDADINGLILRGDDCAVLGLWVRGFPEAGILVEGGRGAVIGGAQAGQGNVLTGNGAGLRVTGAASTLTVEGNFIGVLPDGTAAGNRTGIFLDGLGGELRAVRIGGERPSAGNTIAGNEGSGLFARRVAGLTLLFNRIGADPLAFLPVPNQLSGVDLSDCREVVIGRPPFFGNIISGNGEHGILIRQTRPEPAAIVIEANRIGVDRAGEAAISNRGSGIVLDGAAGVRIGGADPGAGNVISSNRRRGIEGRAAADVVIAGNIIGADGAGLLPLANSAEGIFFENSSALIIGGAAANLISGNLGAGIALYDCAGSGVHANRIGLGSRGDAMGNRQAAILLNGCREIRLGGDSESDGNDIAYNLEGVSLTGGSSGCLIRHNRLYCNGRGILAVAGVNADMRPPDDMCVTAADITGAAAPGAVVDIYRHDAVLCPDAPCQGRTFVGTAQANAEGRWRLSGDFAAAADQYTATATDAAGNTSPFSACESLRERPLARASNDGPYCPLSPMQLRGDGDGDGALTFHWQGPGGYRSTEQNPGDATRFGRYYLVVGFEGCYSLADSTDVAERDALQYTIGDDPSEWICPRDSLVVNGTAYHAGRRQGEERIAGAGGECDTIVTIDLQVREPVPGILQETLCPGETLSLGAEVFNEQRPSGEVWLPGAAADGCDSLVRVSVSFVMLEPRVGLRGVTCPGIADGSLVVFDVSGGAPPYRLALDGGPFRDLSGQPLRFDNLSPGGHTLDVEDAAGCRRRLVYAIERPPRHFLYLGEDLALAAGDSLALRPQLNFEPAAFFWTPASGLSCGDCLHPVARPVQTTTYTLTAVTPEGCRLTASLTLTVDRTRILYTPTAFSPNGDGVNDRFTVYGGQRSVRRVIALRVFDRWGALVYQAAGLTPGDDAAGWDGAVGGRPAPAGVYVYTVEAELQSGEVVALQGEVSLLR